MSIKRIFFTVSRGIFFQSGESVIVEGSMLSLSNVSSECFEEQIDNVTSWV